MIVVNTQNTAVQTGVTKLQGIGIGTCDEEQDFAIDGHERRTVLYVNRCVVVWDDIPLAQYQDGTSHVIKVPVLGIEHAFDFEREVMCDLRRSIWQDHLFIAQVSMSGVM